MYLGYQKNINGELFVAVTGKTAEELELLPMKLEKITEASEDYSLYDGKFLTAAEILQIAKVKKLEEIRSDFEDEVELTGHIAVAELDGFEVDARRKDLININGLIDIYDEPVAFFGYNDFRPNTNWEELHLIKRAIIKAGNDRYVKKWNLENLIDQAKSLAELESVAWGV